MKKLQKRVLLGAACLILAAAMTLCAVSCTKVHAEELSADFKGTKTAEEKTDGEFDAAVAEFSLTLFGAAAQRGQNTALSPLSALLCLGMVANGAENETRAQLEALFGMDLQTLNEGALALMSGLYDGKKCRVSISDSLWINADFPYEVSEDFLQANADWYDSEVYRAPYDEKIKDDINNWVKHKTDGLIGKILDEPPYYESALCAVNTVLFDAKWQEKYEKDDIKDLTFTGYGKKSVTLPFLCSSERYYKDGEVQAFGKDYYGGRYSFMGILPPEDADVYDFAASLDGKAWQRLLGSRDGSADVKFPEFRYEFDVQLKEVLQSLGVCDMFDETKADFGALFEQSEAKTSFNSVRQKAVIDVSRNGTKAAAATIAVDAKGEDEAPRVLVLDRPFLWAIVDNETGVPLFLGIVAELGA